MAAKVVFKWHGPKVLAKTKREMARRLDRCSIVLESGLKDDVGVVGIIDPSKFPGGVPSKLLATAPSAPGEPPHKVTGFLQTNIGWISPRVLMRRIGTGQGSKSSVGYAFFLEFGTRFMAARPWLRPGFYKRVFFIREILGKRMP